VVSFELGQQLSDSQMTVQKESHSGKLVEDKPGPTKSQVQTDESGRESSENQYMDFTYQPLEGGKWTFLGLSNGLRLKAGGRQLLYVKPTEKWDGTWLTFPIIGTKKTVFPSTRSRFRRSSEDLVGSV
jgi:hypothetical protein